MFVCCKLLLLLFSRRVKSAVTFSSLSVDELCDYVTSFEHGKVQCVGVGGGGMSLVINVRACKVVCRHDYTRF